MVSLPNVYENHCDRLAVLSVLSEPIFALQFESNQSSSLLEHHNTLLLTGISFLDAGLIHSCSFVDEIRYTAEHYLVDGLQFLQSAFRILDTVGPVGIHVGTNHINHSLDALFQEERG